MALCLPALVAGQPKTSIPLQYLDQSFGVYDKLQKQVWSAAELGFLENQSSHLLQQHLRENGFNR